MGERATWKLANSIQGDALLVEVTDRRSYNAGSRSSARFDPGLADRPIGGLGVLLVKQIVGSLSYRHQDGQNTLSFRFPGNSTGREKLFFETW